MSTCFHVFVRWVVWYCGLLWLVIFAVVSRCDLMCRLIRLHTRGCVGSHLFGCLSVHWETLNTTNCIGVGLGRVDGQVKEWVWAAGGLFGDEITVLVEGMYVKLFICC